MNQALHITLRVVLSLACAALLLVPLWWWGGLSFRELFDAFARISLSAYLGALALHVALYVLRALRFRVLLPPGERVAFPPFLAVCAAHTLAAFVLPAKIGEATFVVYAGRVCGLSARSAIASLVVSRLLDLATLCLSFALACFVLQALGTWPAIVWFVPLGLALTLLSVALFVLSARGDLLVRSVAWFARVVRVERTSRGARLLERAGELAAALRTAGGEGRLLRATLLSLPIWLSIFLFCAVLARGLGLPSDVSFAEAIFGSSLAILTSLVPVSSFASFGTLEAGWVLGFGTLGVPRELAAATGVGLHVVQLANVVVLGLVGHVGMALARRTRR